MSNPMHHFIPKHGGYKNSPFMPTRRNIFDATVYFTKRFYRIGDRTINQMVQAAHSGK